MASIIFEYKASPEAVGVLQRIDFDAALQGNHDFGVDITSHPVAQGVNISDHAKPQQAMLTIQALVTNTPLTSTQLYDDYRVPSPILMEQVLQVISIDTQRQMQQGRVVPPIVANDTRFVPRAATKPVAEPGVWVTDTNYYSAYVGQSGERVNRAQAVFRILAWLAANAHTLRLVMDNATYTNVMIEKMSVPEEAEDALKFSLTFKQVRFVATRTVSITKKKPKQKRAEVKQPQGPKAAYKKPDEEEDLKSLAVRGTDAVTGKPSFVQ